MGNTDGPSKVSNAAGGASWRERVEWFWRGEAIRRAREAARPLDAAARESAGRARALAALAERHLAEREPWTHGAGDAPDGAVGVALLLYRDAEREARAAIGDAPGADDATTLDARVELESARARVGALLERLARESGDVDPLLAQRFVRVGGLVAALTLAAVAPRLAWYATHPDRGPDAPWTASSAEVGYSTTGRGFAPPDYKVPMFFHTSREPSPWVSFDLEHVVAVRAVTVVNRGDCCDDRAVPLALEVSEDGTTWRELARRTETFTRWEPRFAVATARWVRLRATRPTHLHLESVAIR